MSLDQTTTEDEESMEELTEQYFVLELVGQLLGDIISEGRLRGIAEIQDMLQEIKSALRSRLPNTDDSIIAAALEQAYLLEDPPSPVYDFTTFLCSVLDPSRILHMSTLISNTWLAETLKESLNS